MRGPTRRTVLGTATCVVAATSSGLWPAFAAAADAVKKGDGTRPSVVGPREGFTPLVGTLVSMLVWMRMVVVRTVKGMSTADLDFLLDSKANTIGALLLHLAATETYYGLSTFGERRWGSGSNDIKKEWDIPMNLGEPARKAIKGNSLDHYLTILGESRERNLAELRKRDDKWWALVDPQGANNYAKWFHVAEHESNHDGQIKFLKS